MSSVRNNEERAAEEATPNLGHRAARGTFVTLAGQGGTLLVQMVSVIVLARLLTPTAYGLVAMVLAVVGVAHIFRDFGLSPAAIQAPTLSREQSNNLFWLNTAIGLVLTVVIALAAPLIQLVYNAEHLAEITRVLSLSFLLNGAATQFRADLNRRMAFFKLAVADFTSAGLALAAAVAMAVMGGGYWALVTQQLLQAAVMLVLVIIFCGWLPKRWARGASIKPFVKFGWHYIGAQLINYVANNLDSFLIGYRFGAAPAGLYNRAFQLLTRPLTQLRSPSSTVALPTLSKLQNEPVRYGQYLQKGQVALCYPITMLLAVLAGASVPIVTLLLGSEWLGAAPILRWLTVAGVFQTLSFIGFWVYTSMGIVDELRKYTLVSVTIRAACIVAGLHWGVVGVAAGYGIGPLLAWPVSIWWLNRKVTIPAGSLLRGGARISLAGCLGAAAAWGTCGALSTWPVVGQILAAIVATLLVCGLLIALLPWYRRDAAHILAITKKGLAKSPTAA